MRIDLKSVNPLEYATPALVIGCYEDSPDDNKLFSQCDVALDSFLARLATKKEFTGKVNTCRLIYTLGKLPAERLLLVGLGKKSDLNDERIRQAAGTAMQALREARVASFASALQQASSSDSALEAVCEGALLGSYSFDVYKTKDKDELFGFDCMTMLLSKGTSIKNAGVVVERTKAIYLGVTLARDLVSHPSNVVTTGYLAETARGLAACFALTCRVLEMDELIIMGMNALVGVGKGSSNPPRLIVLEYHGADDKERPVVLVGKGITFDSGGISIKPSPGMEEMKTDMAGAAAVMGTLAAAAGLKLPLNLVGIIPAAENMPDGNAYKPGDVLTSFSGTTIEITDTDAEGRLVLCDALHYALKYKPAALIDLATLTGACVTALGCEASALMGNNNHLIDSLKKAGERSGERLWELPLWDSYGESMKSDIADLKNAGNGDGGSITAGWFLKQFVGTIHWAHLDIAGTAWISKKRPYTPKGATGVGVRLLIEYLRGMSG